MASGRWKRRIHQERREKREQALITVKTNGNKP
jgi:hypothetical protein